MLLKINALIKNLLGKAGVKFSGVLMKSLTHIKHTKVKWKLATFIPREREREGKIYKSTLTTATVAGVFIKFISVNSWEGIYRTNSTVAASENELYVGL